MTDGVVQQDIREELTRLSQSASKRIATRARITLRVLDGATNHQIANELGVSSSMVATWRVRFEQHGPPGLLDRPRRGRPPRRPPEHHASHFAAGRPTLAGVVEDLGAGVLAVVAAPSGLDAEVAHVVFDDPVDPPSIEANDLVLGVGASPGTGAFRVIERAGAAKAAGVVLKDAVVAEPVRLAAATAGVAVLAVPAGVEWGRAHSLIRTSLGGRGVPTEESVPLGDLFALANAVAALAGGPTVIEDPYSIVLAYSSLDEPLDNLRRQVILGRRVPESRVRWLRDSGVFRQLWTSDDVVRFGADSDEEFARIAVGIRADGEYLGLICVAEGSVPLGPSSEAALRQAATLAVPHLLAHRGAHITHRQEAAHITHRQEAAATRDLLDGTSPDSWSASGAGQRLHTVIAFGIAPDEPVRAGQLDRLLDLVALFWRTFRRDSACARIGRTVYTVLGGQRPDTRRVVPAVTDVVDRIQTALGIRVQAGVGSTVDHPELVVNSRNDADAVLQLLAVERSSDTIATIDDVRSQVLFRRLVSLAASDRDLRIGKLNLLIDSDTRAGTGYVRTLRAYLHHFGDAAAAAASEGVPASTFRYRLRRLVQLSGLDLSDYRERLVAEVQLELEALD